MNLRKIFLSIFVVLFVSVNTGCSYLVNRKNDAMDIVDLGITVTSKPCFALYIDVGPVLPLGVSYIDGKLIGLGRSTFGVHDFRQIGYGYLIGGELQRGVDNYDPENPDSPRTYGTGIKGYMEGTTIVQNDPALEEEGRPKTRPTCPKNIHIGWIGVEWGCKIWDMVDFILGWTTLDVGDDDISETSDE